MKKTLSFLYFLVTAFVLQASEIKPVTVPENFGADEHFTVMTWVNIPKEMGRIDASGFGIKGYAFAVRGSLEDGVQFYLGLNQGVPEFKYYVAGKSWYGIIKKADQKILSEICSDKWFHIAGVRDGKKMSLYINGKLVEERNNLPSLPQVSGPAHLGGIRKAGVCWDHRFPGYLKKYEFLPMSLSAEAIREKISSQMASLPAEMPSLRPFPKPDLKEKLPMVEKWERTRKPSPIESGNCVCKVVMDAGRPRVQLNGKIVDATLAIPTMWNNREKNRTIFSDFAAAGVKFFMDIWFTNNKSNNWWLGEGEYDFKAFDRRIWDILESAPGGYIIPRIKLDPPQWWSTANPDEMLAGYINPASGKWQDLIEGMLRDVVTHIENSEYASRIVGYNFGALVGGEWISRRKDIPKEYDAKYWEGRANSCSVPLLKAARVIKEITKGNKLTGVFFGYPQPEHVNMMQVVSSPDIDFFTSPVSYNGRRAGESGRMSTPFQGTYRLHGKLYWSEADERTHLSEYGAIWHPSWHQLDEAETDGAMMRDLGWALTSGHEIWWFSIAGSETFHDEHIMKTVRKGVELAEKRPSEPRISEVAVFTPVWCASDPAEKRSTDMKGSFLNQIVPICGVPFDSYELADLANPNLPKYKAAIVLKGFHGYMPEPVDKDMKLWVIENEKDLPKKASELREWCLGVGAHLWCETYDTFSAGCGFAFIHAATEGDKKIFFPNGKIWKGHLKQGETKILFL